MRAGRIWKSFLAAILAVTLIIGNVSFAAADDFSDLSTGTDYESEDREISQDSPDESEENLQGEAMPDGEGEAYGEAMTNGEGEAYGEAMPDGEEETYGEAAPGGGKEETPDETVQNTPDRDPEDEEIPGETGSDTDDPETGTETETQDKQSAQETDREPDADETAAETIDQESSIPGISKEEAFDYGKEEITTEEEGIDKDVIIPSDNSDSADSKEQKDKAKESVEPIGDEKGSSDVIANKDVKSDDKKETSVIKVEKNKKNGRYSVKVTGFSASGTVTGLKAAVWSEENGQDDLTWHNMTLSQNGVYSFASHINDFQSYGKIHVWIYTVKKSGKESLWRTRAFKIKAPSAKDLKITKNRSAGSLKIKVSGVTSEFAVQYVKAMVWRDSDMSDHRWYKMESKASGSVYTANSISPADFGGCSGKYHIRVVAYPRNGTSRILKETVYNYKDSAGSISYVDKHAGKAGKMQKVYKVSLSGAARPGGVKEVEFEIWSENDKKLKKIYQAVPDGDGKFSAEVWIRDFKLDGQYVARAYVTEYSGAKTCVGSRKIMNVDGRLGGTVSVISRKDEKGRFVLKFSGSKAPSGVKSVEMTAWTKEDRSDGFTYKAKAGKDGSFTATVDIKNHNYNIGVYKVTVSGVMGNGVEKNRKTESFKFYSKDLTFVTEPAFGLRTVGINNPSYTKDVKFAVWSDKNGQDDLKWYSAKRSGKQYTASVDLNMHRDIGKYHVHVYSGKRLIGQKTFTVKKGEDAKNGWYYESYAGETLKFYYVAGVKQTDLRGKVNGPYQVRVNRVCNVITIYAKDGNNGFIIPVAAFLCSVGKYNPSPLGHHRLTSKLRWRHFVTWDSWAQYACRYTYGTFFHSVTYHDKSVYALQQKAYSLLGSPASHGCIRMTVEGSKWLYDHMSLIEDVWIYDGSQPGPFGKPANLKAVKTKNGWYDPTDPEA